jgi:hypothetical protein
MIVALCRMDTERAWWRCAGCGAKLGEIVNGSVIIVQGRRTWVVPIANGVQARCKCGRDNDLSWFAA